MISPRDALAVVVASAVLVGTAACSSTPPAALTDSELRDYVETQNQQTWEVIQHGVDLQRPEVPVVRFLNADDFGTVFECMADEGVPIEYLPDGGVTWTVEEGAEDAAAIAQYTCRARYPFYPPQFGYFSDEQRAYLYDYYQDVLIPCLVLRDYAVSPAPTRAEFLDPDNPASAWSPYDYDANPMTQEEAMALDVQCPSIPFRAPVAD